MTWAHLVAVERPGGQLGVHQAGSEGGPAGRGADTGPADHTAGPAPGQTAGLTRPANRILHSRVYLKRGPSILLARGGLIVVQSPLIDVQSPLIDTQSPLIDAQVVPEPVAIRRPLHLDHHVSHLYRRRYPRLDYQPH